MAGIGAKQPRFSRRRRRQQIAGDIARRQADGAHRGNANMGQILAHAGADLEHPVQRRGDVGDGGVVAEIPVDAVHQFHRARQYRPVRRKAHAAIGRDIAAEFGHGRVELILHHVPFFIALRIFQPRSHVFPRNTVARDALRRGLHRDAALRQHVQMGMRLVNGKPFARILEIILARDTAGGVEAERDAAVMHRLQRRGPRPEMRQVPGMRNILQIAIGGAMSYDVFHLTPPGKSRCRCGCGWHAGNRHRRWHRTIPPRSR